MRTAIMVDGGFFLRRFRTVFSDTDADDPAQVARRMHRMALAHLNDREGRRIAELHRIFFYDCPPLMKKVHRPVSRRSWDLARSDQAQFRLALHDEIRRLRKTALRLGRLDERNAAWQIRADRLRDLLNGRRRFEELVDEDFIYEARQKTVDMKIGLDIAGLALKGQVGQIVLIAGDSDFVPAAKVARREGIDFVLDPLWQPIGDDLQEHVDGLRSVVADPRRQAARDAAEDPDP